MNGFTQNYRRKALLAAGSALIFVMVTALYKASACPFCLSPPQTLAEQVSRADIAMIAELVRFRVYDGGTRPESTLRIREYLHGDSIASTRKELAVGQAIVISAEATGQPGDLFLMFGSLPEDPAQLTTSTFASGESPADARDVSLQGSVVTANLSVDSSADLSAGLEKVSLIVPEWISWNETLAVSGDAVQYLRKAPAASAPQRTRLEYFIPFLEHPDALIAIDAWAEFGNSSYDDVISVRQLLPRNKLRAWIADPAMSPERLGLYGMMLGLSGTADDAAFLLQQMQSQDSDQMPGVASADQPKRFRFGAEGLMGGYLLLTGENGLAQLEQTIVTPADTPDTACHAFVQSLQFMWSYESDIISEDRIRQSMRLLLQKESMREIAITNLSRWTDWQTLSLLTQMFDSDCSDDRSTQRAIIQFAQACLKNQKAQVQSSAYAGEAEEFLCRVHATRPDLLSSNRREFQAPQ